MNWGGPNAVTLSPSLARARRGSLCSKRAFYRLTTPQHFKGKGAKGFSWEHRQIHHHPTCVPVGAAAEEVET